MSRIIHEFWCVPDGLPIICARVTSRAAESTIYNAPAKENSDTNMLCMNNSDDKFEMDCEINILSPYNKIPPLYRDVPECCMPISRFIVWLWMAPSDHTAVPRSQQSGMCR